LGADCWKRGSNTPETQRREAASAHSCCRKGEKRKSASVAIPPALAEEGRISEPRGESLMGGGDAE